MGTIKHVGCKIEGCPKEHHARGWCRNHYNHWLEYGDPLPMSPEARAIRRSEIGKIGGTARAASTTPEQRSAMVAKGNHSRKLRRLEREAKEWWDANFDVA